MDLAEFKKVSQKIWWRDAQNVYHRQVCADVASPDVSAGFANAMNVIIDTINGFTLLIDHLLGDLPDNQ